MKAMKFPLSAIFLIIILFTNSVPAAANPPGGPASCGAITGTFNYVVKCSETLLFGVVGYTLDASGNIVLPSANAPPTTFVTNLTSSFRPIVLIVLILAVAMFGYRVMSGEISERDIKKESAMFVVKFALVTWLSINFGFGQLYTWLMALMQGVVNVFSSYSANAPCGDPVAYADVWLRTDCMMNYFMGINATVYSSPYVILFIIFALLFMGGLGIILAGMLFAGTMMIIAAFATAAFAYIMSIIAITFLFSFAPIVLPLSLFPSSRVNGLFKRWANFLVSYSLQPMVILGYLALMISVLNAVLFGGNGNAGLYNLLNQVYTAISTSVPYTFLSIGGFSLSIPTIDPTWWWDKATGIYSANLISLLVNSAAAMLTTFLLFTFMINVVHFSSQILGLEGSGNFTGKFNVLSIAMNAGKSGADILKKLSSGQLKKAASSGAGAMGSLANDVARR